MKFRTMVDNHIMIDPINITEYNATTSRLQEILLFSVLASNNGAMVASKGLELFLNKVSEIIEIPRVYMPFFLISNYYRYVNEDITKVSELLKECGIGKNTKKSRSFIELSKSKLHLRRCTTEELETIYGIGKKTSRFFILHTRPNVEYAALDTHILQYMRDVGIDAPKTAPSSSLKYKQLENKFITLAHASGKTVADFDLEIWNQYSKHRNRLAVN